VPKLVEAFHHATRWGLINNRTGRHGAPAVSSQEFVGQFFGRGPRGAGRHDANLPAVEIDPRRAGA
jgi:hypothetical protein